jgi:hypothetical protein
LLTLESIDATGGVYARCDAGMRTVPVDKIRGSEGRACDFDCDFNPLGDHNKERWLRVAAARQQGKALPPVALVRVGDLYFVRDGHHRVSVARALGQLSIEAQVMVWQVEGPLPWDTPTRAPIHESAGQPMGLERVFGRLQREGARLQERFLLSIRDLLGAVRIALRGPAVPRPGVDRP